jgi:hypothetical protein
MFEGLVSVDDLPRLRTDRMVTQALLVEGRNRARVYEPTGRAPAGFAPAPVTLEDAYLVLMRLGALPEIDESMPSAAIPAGVPAAIHPEATPSYEAPR